MREDIKNRLTGAVRQFRHNSDNSPDTHNPREGFVFGYDREEVDELVGDLLGELEAARAQQSVEGLEAAAIYQWREIGETDWMDCHEDWRRKCDDSPLHDTRTLYTHPPKPQGVPEGWKLVPVDPTHEMEVSGCQGYMIADGQWRMHNSSMGHAYRAMLEAAPIPPADKPEGEWVKCSERLPTEDDADALRQIWIYSDVLGVLPLSKDSFSEPPFYTHWMPTGLTRPAAPDIGGEK